jgi:hypothetical protein
VNLACIVFHEENTNDHHYWFDLTGPGRGCYDLLIGEW